MFNNDKITDLHLRCKGIEDELQRTDERLLRNVRNLESYILTLIKHFGLEFQDVNERRVVAIKTFEKFKQ